jgi:hypothetical protein
MQNGQVLVAGEQEVRVGDLAFAVDPQVPYRIVLHLPGPGGART